MIVVGAGQMARAMVAGWQRVDCPFSAIYTVDPHQVQGLGENIMACAHPEDLPPLPQPFVVMFAVKPQILGDLLPQWAEIAKTAQAVFSIAAGFSCARLQMGLGRSVIRLMPNTPVAVGSGIIGAYIPPEDDCGPAQALIQTLFAPLGVLVPVASEDDLNRITAFSGSGPAFVYAFLEGLEQAALSLGFSPDQAPVMAQMLMQGSLSLKDASPQSAAALREAVTSKGGTTEAGLSILMHPQNGLFPLLKATVQAAYQRAGGIR
ncbi:MAG: pyrroline-5-carboxylate reductase family protein [Alphaproteobacteria bacterium]